MTITSKITAGLKNPRKALEYIILKGKSYDELNQKYQELSRRYQERIEKSPEQSRKYEEQSRKYKD